jgi:hypothetical protein
MKLRCSSVGRVHIHFNNTTPPLSLLRFEGPNRVDRGVGHVDHRGRWDLGEANNCEGGLPPKILQHDGGKRHLRPEDQQALNETGMPQPSFCNPALPHFPRSNRLPRAY